MNSNIDCYKLGLGVGNLLVVLFAIGIAIVIYTKSKQKKRGHHP